MLLLPLTGRRNAGVKFYRMVLVIAASLVSAAAVSLLLTGHRSLALGAVAVAAVTFGFLAILRYPRRLIYRLGFSLVIGSQLVLAIVSFHAAVGPSHPIWSLVGSASAILLLGSVNLAMILGHWYLVVRGMPIDPLKRLSLAILASSVGRTVVVAAALLSISSAGIGYGTALHKVMIGDGIFFWMRVGWGLFALLALFPMIWGTVRIRSTMAATGILYVGVVAAIIGEVLSMILSVTHRLPL
ncbi:MAG TPA: hypothetical protein VM534_00950 [Thermoanaerobaculia bacterium]|nr:hypothetical protein [Thermoanaerobaculia bacterium]